MAEDLLPELGLEADLELGFDFVLLLRSGDRMAGGGARRKLVGIFGVDDRKEVHRLVGPQAEGAELRVAGELPAAVEERLDDRRTCLDGLAAHGRRGLGHELQRWSRPDDLRWRRLCDAARAPVAAQGAVVTGQAVGVRGDADAGFGRDRSCLLAVRRRG